MLSCLISMMHVRCVINFLNLVLWFFLWHGCRDTMFIDTDIPRTAYKWYYTRNGYHKHQGWQTLGVYRKNLALLSFFRFFLIKPKQKPNGFYCKSNIGQFYRVFFWKKTRPKNWRNFFFYSRTNIKYKNTSGRTARTWGVLFLTKSSTIFIHYHLWCILLIVNFYYHCPLLYNLLSIKNIWFL